MVLTETHILMLEQSQISWPKMLTYTVIENVGQSNSRQASHHHSLEQNGNPQSHFSQRFLWLESAMEALAAFWQFVTSGLVPECARELSVKADEGLEDIQILGASRSKMTTEGPILQKRC